MRALAQPHLGKRSVSRCKNWLFLLGAEHFRVGRGEGLAGLQVCASSLRAYILPLYCAESHDLGCGLKVSPNFTRAEELGCSQYLWALSWKVRVSPTVKLMGALRPISFSQANLFHKKIMKIPYPAHAISQPKCTKELLNRE